MKAKHLLLVSLMYAVACPAILLAQRQPASPPDTGAPLLTLEDAVSLALTNNRLVKNSALEAQKFDFRVGTARSRRLPQFQFAVLGGELMHSFDFTFPAGAFGTYANGRPFPRPNQRSVHPARFTTYITGAFDQPITQQYKIGLGIRATELGRQIAREDVRAERQKIAAEVRTAYFDLVATQAGVEAAREAVKTLEEAQRITTRYIAEKTVLRGDALEVDARLAKGRYELSVAENGLATQREHLNQLLGRDLGTRFRVDSMPEEAATDLTLDAARDKASQNRPEIRQAHAQGEASGIRPPHRQSRIHPRPQLVREIPGAQQRPRTSGERRHCRLLLSMGTIRLGTPPQQRSRKGQDRRTGAQRSAGNGVADRG